MVYLLLLFVRINLIFLRIISGDLIKKETGKSAQEYIQFTIIEKVKERFADSSKSVSEIAYEMGFKYPHHLSRLFKKMEGCSPNEYRVALNY